MVENAPPSVDLQEFQFKLHSKLKIFDNIDDSKFKNAYNLVAAASRYGLVFVGTPNGTLEVIQLQSIENSSLTKVESTNFPRRSVPLGAVPSHLTVNCDQTLLAVICYKNDCATAVIYNVASFFSQNLAVVREIRVSATVGVHVLEAGWNPAIPGCLTACKADGSLGVYNINENSVECNELPVAAAARCFCWSPKGKQLVVGSTNGSLTQYKPDLKAVKVIAAPVLRGAGPYCVLSVFWISNYQFIAVYQDNVQGESRLAIVVVNAPKTGPTTYINYDDICYSYGTLRGPQYYIVHQPTWGIMLLASANSNELATLGLSSPNDPALWVQWMQSDASRAELPLSASHAETYPVGVAFDTGVQLQLPWGENQLLPPMPFVYLLSHHGVLCAFSVINIKDGVSAICQRPEAISAEPGVFQEVQQQAAPTAQVKPQSLPPAPPAYSSHQSSNLPPTPPPSTFGALTSAPAFSSAQTTSPFGSLAQKLPSPAFGGASSIASPLANIPSPASSASLTSPPGSLPGWSAGSTLFGGTTFGNLATSAPTTVINLGTTASSKIATTTAPSSGNIFGGSSLPNPGVSSNLFGNLGLGAAAGKNLFGGFTSVSNTGAAKMAPLTFNSPNTTATTSGETTAPGVANKSAPMFNVGSTSPASFGPPNVAAVKPNISSAPLTIPVVSSAAKISAAPATPPAFTLTSLAATSVASPTVSLATNQLAASSPAISAALSANQQLAATSPAISAALAANQQLAATLSASNQSSATSVASPVASLGTNLQVAATSPAFSAAALASYQQLAAASTASANQLTITPVSKPLLSTPKQVAKPDILPQNQTLTTSESVKKEESINDQILQNMIKEEVRNFQSELYELFTRCKAIKLDVGTEEEKTKLVLTTETLLEFYKELQDITDSQVAEVHFLKPALIQSFAWYEDSKARHRRYSDPNYSFLLQAQELDPVSEKQLADIKHLIYYIEAQLKQIDSFLDNQWADFQDSCKKHVKGKLHMPTLEPIYQSMVRQNAILQKQKYFLKDIKARIKSRNKKAAESSHVMNANLTKSKFFDIDKEMRNLNINHGDLFAARYDRVLVQEKKFTDLKQSKLCSFFTNRNVTHISPKKPKFVNNTPSKLNSFATLPSVQRNLAQAFNKMDSTYNNSVEANISSSNLFSFTLLDGVTSTKLHSPEKADKRFGPKTSEAAKPAASKVATNLFASTTGSVFSFSATNALNTQSKPVVFGSGDLPAQFVFSGAAKATPSKFSSQIPTQEVSKDIIKPSVQKSTTESIGFVGTIEKPFNFTLSQNKPAVQATSATKPVATSSIITPVTTATIISSIPMYEECTTQNTESNLPPRDSIGPAFNLGILTSGQQSTPKPKSPGISNFNAPQAKQLESIAKPAATIAKPIASVAATIPTTIAVPKPVFATVQPSATTTVATSVSKPETVATSAPIVGSSIFGGLAFSKAATGTFFGTAQTSVSTGSGFSTSTASTAVTGSIFGAKAAQPETKTPDSTNIATSITVATTTVAATPASATPSSATPTTTVTGFSFTQAISNATSKATVKTPENIFGGISAAKEVISSNSGSIFGSATSSNSETSTKTSETVFEGASTNEAAPKPAPSIFGSTNEAIPKSTSGIFGSTVATGTTTKPSGEITKPATNIQPETTGSIFGGAATSIATSPATGFSFIQQISTGSTPIATTTTVVTTPASVQKPTAILAEKSSEVAVTSTTPVTTSATSNTPASTTIGFGVTSPTFGFGSLAVSSPTTNPNNFSFGNLNVSALSPAATSTTTTISNSSGFSFAQAIGTSTTAATTSSGGFGSFSSNLFGKPAQAVTTTTASSFMGQPICSPSTFSQGGTGFGQNTGNIFAQKSSTTPSSTSIFGQTQTNNPFGGNPATTQTSGSIFNQPSSFGTPTTSGSIFGQSTFGSPATTSTTSFSFTQNTTPAFGASGGSIFGAKPAFGATPAFGQPPAFGSSPAFGAPSTGGSIFGSPAGANTSGGNFGSGFGSPSAFGQKAAFGSPPSFGQSGFGSPPAFGGSPSFGSPQRVFGSGAAPATGSFGSTVQENSTFANLASQPTIGFGNLVQNQPPQQQQPPQFSGGAQFSSWR